MLLLASCEEKQVGLPYYDTPDFTPLFNDTAHITPHRLADFSFTDQHGDTITQATIEGKIHVADFFFSSCTSICPVMTHNMSTISDTFRDDPGVVLLSYSVTPWLDSTARLHEFAEGYHITDPNWHLLTGSQSAIYDLARKSYFAEEDIGFAKDSSEFLHTEHFILVDKNKRIRGIYNGTLKLEIVQLIKDIRALKEE